mgnify:CR=1 FL=1
MHRRKELASKRCVKTFAAMLVTLATMLACVLIGPVHAQAVEYNIGELGWVDKDSSKLTIVSGGQEKPFISGTTVDYGDEIDMQLHWNVPNSVTVKSGDTFVYDLPENLTFQSGQQYDIINGSGDVVGHYVINGNRMVATYTRGEDAGSNVTAYVTVKGAINSDKTGGNNGGDKTFSYPGYGDVTLYAEWTRTSHQWTIKFDLNGGAAPEGKEATKLYADQKVYDGDPLISPTVDQTNVPVLEGYEFQGWSTVRNDALATSVLSFDENGKSLMPIDRDGTVYALWAKMGTVGQAADLHFRLHNQSQIGAYSNTETGLNGLAMFEAVVRQPGKFPNTDFGSSHRGIHSLGLTESADSPYTLASRTIRPRRQRAYVDGAYVHIYVHIHVCPSLCWALRPLRSLCLSKQTDIRPPYVGHGTGVHLLSGFGPPDESLTRVACYE